MAIGISVATDLNGVSADVTVTGLSTSTFYDVYRLQMRYLGEDGAGAPVYERELPDRRALWSAVGHRVHWKPTATTATFRDYEAPVRAFRYFVVPNASVGPFEWNFRDGDYPTSRGILGPVIHLKREAEESLDSDVPNLGAGDLVVRSTTELGVYAVACLVEMDGPTFTARGAEFAVIGRTYPMFVSDTREAPRGSITLLVRDVGQLNELRRIVFPATGQMNPAKLSSGGDPALLLDDLMVMPLDVEVEQATPADADRRYVHIDYLSVDPSMPLLTRDGDNDDLLNAPKANFTISDKTPKRGQKVTIQSTSTGNFTNYDWSIGRGSSNKVSKFYGPGPYTISWDSTGDRYVKLRVYTETQQGTIPHRGVSSKSVKVQVHK